MNSRLIRYLTLFLSGLIAMILYNYSYIQAYLSPGMPAGFDGSGHFAISQLYYRSHWPKFDGYIEAYFQGFHFPRFYPPLFYLLLGFFYHSFPGVEPELIFKLFVILSVLVLPGTLAMLAQVLGVSFRLNLIIIYISTIMLSRQDEVVMGLKDALLVGLCTQAQSAFLLLLILTVIFASLSDWIKSTLLAFLCAAFFISNFHVILTAAFLLPACLAIESRRNTKIPWGSLAGIGLGFLTSFAWYYSVFMHRYETPSVPIEGVRISQLISALSWLSLTCMLVILLAKAKDFKISSFSNASLITFIIICLGPELIDIRLPWQPHRLISVLNLFLPIYIIGAYLCLYDLFNKYAPTAIPRLRLGMAIILMIFFFSREPINYQGGKLNQNYSYAISKLTSWLARNPSEGYFVIPLSDSSDGAEHLEVAASHYIPLSGNKGLWSAFRESSFNSVFMTHLRNIISEKKESWGIPQETRLYAKKAKNFEKNLQILNNFGVDRIIFRTDSTFLSRAKRKLLKIEYRDQFFSVAKIKKPAIYSFTSDNVVFFVSEAVAFRPGFNKLDFSRLGQLMLYESNKIPPVLLFNSCNQLIEKMGAGPWKVACSSKDWCCSKITNTIVDLKNINLVNKISVEVINKTPVNQADLVASPWRQARRIQ